MKGDMSMKTLIEEYGLVIVLAIIGGMMVGLLAVLFQMIG